MQILLPSLLRRRARQDGSTLVLTLFILVVVTSTLGGYMLYATHNNKYARRTDLWEASIHVAEAGIDEAMAHYKFNYASLATQGWADTGTNFLKKTFVDEDYYIVTISKTANPVITSAAYVMMPTMSGELLTRRVRVTAQPKGGGFRRAITTKGQIEFNGHPLDVDSYDSTDPSASTGGLYDPAKHRDHGDVAMNGKASFALGAGKVFGKLQSGPGGKVTSFSPGGAGDLAWFAASKSGIKPGWFTDDANMTFPTVTLPSLAWFSIPSANTTLTAGNYQINSVALTDGQTLNVTGAVTLYVKGKLSTSGTGSINIAPGGSLTVYVAGDSASFTGTGVVNQTQNPANFTFYGMPMNTYVGIKSPSFIGTVYSPNAELEMGTGGSNYTMIGGAVSLNIQLNGDWHFHYDESLAIGAPRAAGT